MERLSAPCAAELCDHGAGPGSLRPARGQNRDGDPVGRRWGGDEPFPGRQPAAAVFGVLLAWERLHARGVEAGGECISGLPRDAFRAFGMFYPDERDRRTGKALVYCDLLYPLGPQGEELRESVARSEEALSLLAPYQHLPECRYASALFEVCRQKALLLTELRPRYLAGDRAWLDDMARRRIPELLDAYKTLRAQHRALWERDNKRNGWEVMALRYGSVIGRLEDVQDAVLRYCAGTLSALCELEEEPLDSSRKFGMQFYSTYVSPVWNV